jgi:hypothetical protein
MRIVELCRSISKGYYKAHVNYNGTSDSVGVWISDADNNTLASSNFALPNTSQTKSYMKRNIEILETVLHNLECMNHDNDHFKKLPFCAWRTEDGRQVYNLEEVENA